MTQPTQPTPSLAELQARAQARKASKARQAPSRHGAPTSTSGQAPLIDCSGLVRIFQSEGVEVVALQGLDLRVYPGELIAIVGASGSGKSTLLSILSGLDTPTAGKVTVAGVDLLAMSAAARLAYRRHTVGFVFQQTASNLLPYLTAAQNIEMPLRATRTPAATRRDRVAQLLDVLGLAGLEGRLPSQLSGGQQQRVAIAVALANSPQVILADEPTGELDSATSADVYQAFEDVNKALGVTVVIVTHDPTVAQAVNRTVAIRDGRTASEVLRTGSHDDRQVAEYAVLDKSGRVQLPIDMIDALGLGHRVRVELADGHISIWPAEERHSS